MMMVDDEVPALGTEHGRHWVLSDEGAFGGLVQRSPLLPLQEDFGVADRHLGRMQLRDGHPIGRQRRVSRRADIRFSRRHLDDPKTFVWLCSFACSQVEGQDPAASDRRARGALAIRRDFLSVYEMRPSAWQCGQCQT